MKELGNNLRKYREHNCFTQKELADFIGCPREMISYYESGSRIPKIDILSKISDLFGIELADLLEESSEIVEENIVLSFRKDDLIANDIEEIASFKKIIKNYLKMERLTSEYGV